MEILIAQTLDVPLLEIDHGAVSAASGLSPLIIDLWLLTQCACFNAACAPYHHRCPRVAVSNSTFGFCSCILGAGSVEHVRPDKALGAAPASGGV